MYCILLYILHVLYTIIYTTCIVYYYIYYYTTCIVYYLYITPSSLGKSYAAELIHTSGNHVSITIRRDGEDTEPCNI